MNNSEIKLTIDRLVDGELPVNELAPLIADFDTRPELWRDCAMAFIEAAEVKHVLKELVAEPAVRPTTTPANRNWAALAVAACLCVLCFVGGTLFNSSEPSSAVAVQPDMSVETNEAVTSTEPKVVGFARILGRQEASPLIPVMGGPTLDERTLLNRPRSVPEHLGRRARNNGIRLKPVRQVVSLTLADGQKLAVPLDSLDVRYVGKPIL